VLRRNTHSTQKNELYAIKKLIVWANKSNTDLETLFLQRKFLRPHQIDSLLQSLKKSEKNASREISALKYNNYLASVSRYLCWLAAEIITDSNAPEISNTIDKMAEAISARRVRKAGSDARIRQSLLAKRLPDEARRTLLALFTDPLMGGVTKTSHIGPRYRNVLALRILYDTGMRLGELLGLRLHDFEIASGGEPAYLIVRRYHDDRMDDRVIQPVAKTLERKLPIGQGLENCIREYLNQREDVPQVGFDDKDFLLVNHLGGLRQGKAISEMSFRCALLMLQKKFPPLKEVHPHLLRHDWNYRFSAIATELGLSEIEEQRARENLMGWVEGSSSSSHYNRRHIQKKAVELGLKIAEDTAKKVRT
jgi:integrase